jgi:methionyl-tRNA synthetase
MHNKYIVTFAAPTSNGDLHIGHLSGPYLAADVFTRARRLLGDDVLFISFSDDYNNYVVRKAKQLNVSKEQLVTGYGAQIEKTLAKANIQVNHFMKALNNQHYREPVHQFFHRVSSEGKLFSSFSNIPFCQNCKVYGYEAFARGTCNYCGSSTDPSQCEICAMPPNIDRVGDFKCILCGQEMSRVPVEQLFLNIEHYWGYLSELYQNKPLRPALRQFIDTVLSQPNLTWAITRPHSWGIEVPGDDTTILHTWFNGIAGYYGASVEWSKQQKDPTSYRSYWHNPDTTLVHFIGFDCSFSHALVYPCLLLSQQNDCPTDIWIHTNAFLNLNGHCFSTSRGIAIWASEFLDYVSPDMLRLYLALVAPEQESANFSITEFRDTINEKLFTSLNELMQIVENLIEVDEIPPIEYYTGRLSLLREDWIKAANKSTFSMRTMGSVLVKLIDLMQKLALQHPNALPTLFGIYSLMSLPIQPEFSRKLADYLGLPEQWGRNWLRDGGSLPQWLRVQGTKPAPYFSKISEEVIERFASTETNYAIF